MSFFDFQIAITLEPKVEDPYNLGDWNRDVSSGKAVPFSGDRGSVRWHGGKTYISSSIILSSEL